MKAVIQRVKYASVKVDGKTTGEIGRGFLLLIGVRVTDSEKDADKLAEKISGLRIFEDGNYKMNLSLKDVSGDILSISQFTLYADCRRGRRPGFEEAARADVSLPLYQYFNQALRNKGIHVEEGVFGADMKVELLNDGPVTIILESSEL